MPEYLSLCVPLTLRRGFSRLRRLERQFIENSIIGVDQQVIIDKLDNRTLLKVLNEWFETTLKISSTIENGIFLIIFIGLSLVSYVRMRDSIDFRIISWLTKYTEYTEESWNVLIWNLTRLDSLFLSGLVFSDTGVRGSMNETQRVQPVHWLSLADQQIKSLQNCCITFRS